MNTSLRVTPLWPRWWLGAVRWQAITWTNVDHDACRHMGSLGHQDLIRWCLDRKKIKLILVYLIILFISLIHRAGATPLSEPMLEYCSLEPGNKFKWNLNRNYYISYWNRHWNMSFRKWRPFCLGLNVSRSKPTITILYTCYGIGRYGRLFIMPVRWHLSTCQSILFRELQLWYVSFIWKKSANTLSFIWIVKRQRK